MGYSSHDSSEWNCQDTEVTQPRPGFSRGQTNHLTNYAFLLVGNSEENPEQEEEEAEELELSDEGVPVGVIVGVVIAAVVIIVIGSVAAVAWAKYSNYKLMKEITFKTTLE